MIRRLGASGLTIKRGMGQGGPGNGRKLAELGISLADGRDNGVFPGVLVVAENQGLIGFIVPG